MAIVPEEEKGRIKRGGGNKLVLNWERFLLLPMQLK
jgi:hypothetical protein